MTRNLLADQTSPYLLQHKDNPVHWRPWGDAAFAEARATGKPVLLSIGYAACHWCHVMAHESFEDPQIAELMNRHFVSIKVDREERPDIDHIYQTALALLGEHGGWPLTMFLDADGQPFWGGTYFPPTPRYGRPGFSQILNRIAEIHRDEPDRVAANANALRDAIAKITPAAVPEEGSRPDLAAIDAAAQYALRLVDPANGGTHGAPKFPQPAFFRFLWQAYRRTRAEPYARAVTRTLDAICQGGIYDHLGGGIARYSTDAVWLVPHFEKMLYDNAQILELLSDAWQITRSDLYAVRARETVDWLLRDMRVWAPEDDPADPQAPFAFACAFDADSGGVEGQYYVWSADEIAAVLGDEEADFFNDAYAVTPAGNWEGVNILNRSHCAGLAGDADEARLAAARAKLLAHRSGRVPPLRDDKVLADWNGLAIAALARAAMIFDQPTWLATARSAFEFILRHHGADGRLRHSWRAGQARHPAILDDYANLGRAALTLFEATSEPAYLTQAETWMDIVNSHYRDPAGGGYFLTADDTENLISRPKTIHDNAVPPGNATLVNVLVRLFHLTGKAAYREQADAIINAFAAATPDQYVAMPTLCTGVEALERPIQVVIAGLPDAPDTLSLLRIARHAAPPTASLLYVAPAAEVPPGHPAEGRGLVDGRAAAFVCVGPTCGLPLTDSGLLQEQLDRL